MLTKYIGTVAGTSQIYNNDYPVYRYADVLLLLAEAKAKLGEDISAEINAIRLRAYGTGYTHLAVSSYLAGGLISEYQTTLDVKDITGYQYPYALIWTETGVYTFNYENPILYQIGTYPDPPFLQAIAVNNTEFLCLNSLNTYLYYPVTNVWTIQNFTGGESICYENISQTTLVIKGQSIYSYISSQLIKEKAFSFLPIKINPVYNK